jgi:hypothetical protein
MTIREALFYSGFARFHPCLAPFSAPLGAILAGLFVGMAREWVVLLLRLFRGLGRLLRRGLAGPLIAAGSTRPCKFAFCLLPVFASAPLWTALLSPDFQGAKSNPVF